MSRARAFAGLAVGLAVTVLGCAAMTTSALASAPSPAEVAPVAVELR
jgi:hypothetical protein